MPHELVLIYDKLVPKDFREALCKWHVLCIIWYTSINISLFPKQQKQCTNCYQILDYF